jgi:hypothetical protein
MFHDYSSRRSPLKDFLATQLQGTRRYDRIAGFFSSSLLEVAGEALERMTPESGETCVRVVCNSCHNPLDVRAFPPETSNFPEKSANVISKWVSPDQLNESYVIWRAPWNH